MRHHFFKWKSNASGGLKVPNVMHDSRRIWGCELLVERTKTFNSATLCRRMCLCVLRCTSLAAGRALSSELHLLTLHYSVCVFVCIHVCVWICSTKRATCSLMQAGRWFYVDTDINLMADLGRAHAVYSIGCDFRTPLKYS